MRRRTRCRRRRRRRRRRMKWTHLLRLVILSREVTLEVGAC